MTSWCCTEDGYWTVLKMDYTGCLKMSPCLQYSPLEISCTICFNFVVKDSSNVQKMDVGLDEEWTMLDICQWYHACSILHLKYHVQHGLTLWLTNQASDLVLGIGTSIKTKTSSTLYVRHWYVHLNHCQDFCYTNVNWYFMDK